MSIIQITDSTFDQTLQAKGLVLVDFWAPWCAPCRMVAPILEELAEQTNGKVTIAKLNVDENPVITNKFGIRSIPTLKLFKNGTEVETLVGVQPLEELKDLVLQHS
ncbi:thioredoxin [Risungbinella massiliensis]|uniref:thioredoxin n=1 Tax=Risungbinella massiliensis TaxID=1329796 RepID=UPI0005CC045F|nr:thioredoxin [Risungbinella massiliensis]